MSWFRQQRIASLEVNLADLYYDETKWGWADKPSDKVRRDKRIAKTEAKLEKLKRLENS